MRVLLRVLALQERTGPGTRIGGAGARGGAGIFGWGSAGWLLGRRVGSSEAAAGFAACRAGRTLRMGWFLGGSTWCFEEGVGEGREMCEKDSREGRVSRKGKGKGRGNLCPPTREQRRGEAPGWRRFRALGTSLSAAGEVRSAELVGACRLAAAAGAVSLTRLQVMHWKKSVFRSRECVHGLT